MSDLPEVDSVDPELREKLDNAWRRHRLRIAEEHFFDKAQPHHTLGFQLVYRGPRHWDVLARRVPGKASAWRAANPQGKTSEEDDEIERAFRIRGAPGDYILLDERWDPHRPASERKAMEFRSLHAVMMWLVDELMQEPSS